MHINFLRLFLVFAYFLKKQGKGQQHDQWRGGWQEGRGGGKMSYGGGGGGVVQGSSSSSMDEIMRGRSQNRDVRSVTSTYMYDNFKQMRGY